MIYFDLILHSHFIVFSSSRKLQRTSGSVHPVYYYEPMDKTDVLPETMKDAAGLLYLGIINIANDEKLH